MIRRCPKHFGEDFQHIRILAGPPLSNVCRLEPPSNLVEVHWGLRCVEGSSPNRGQDLASPAGMRRAKVFAQSLPHSAKIDTCPSVCRATRQSTSAKFART